MRRVLSIRNLHTVVVISALGMTFPLLLNRRQHSPVSLGRLDVQVWRRVRRSLEILIEWPGEGRVVEDGSILCRRSQVRTVDISSLASYKIEYVCAHVPASEGVEVPVRFDRGKFGIVVVVLVVLAAFQMLGDSASKEDGEDAVGDRITLVLVESDEDQSTRPEVLVLHKWLEEIAHPSASGRDGRVMAVRSHVWGDEHPLRQVFVRKVLIELGHVLLVGETERGGVCIVNDRWVVLPHVVICTGLLVNPGEPLKARVGHVFLVRAPADVLIFQEVRDCGDVARHTIEGIIVHTEVVTAYDVLEMAEGEEISWISPCEAT